MGVEGASNMLLEMGFLAIVSVGFNHVLLPWFEGKPATSLGSTMVLDSNAHGGPQHEFLSQQLVGSR